jgi:molybdopterin converting factor small subunit
MVTVSLRPPLRDLAGGRREVDVEGATVSDVLRALERDHPRLTGWVLDERGEIRQHVGVFVNGDKARADSPVSDADLVHVLPAISGGEDAELLVGTRKGLFVLRGPRGGSMEVAARAFDGSNVEYAIRDPRTGRYLASVTYGQFGPRVYVTDDATGDWEPTEGPRFPDDADTAVERIWKIQPGAADGLLYAGVAPAALFESRDGGLTWQLNRALWDQPGRKDWQPGFGGLALHSICPWPGEPDRLAIGISAVGVWLTEDGGSSWRHGNTGLTPRYLPEETWETTIDLCVHNMQRSPVRPERLLMQFHGGVYRSDDAGESWNDIAPGLPSDFGFPMVIDPHDPDAAYVIPLVGGEDRVTPQGKVRVYETRDGGTSWSARADGLPQEHAYLTILRQAFGGDAAEPVGLYFGATSGEVFGSADGGATWATVAGRLPPVLSVRVSR